MASLPGSMRPTSSPLHLRDQSGNWKRLKIPLNFGFAVWVGLWTLPLTFSNPHAPQLLVWEVSTPTGQVAWSINGTHTPGAWWPTLHPDVCQLAVGLDTWDVPERDSLTQIPLNSLNRGGVSGTHLDVGCRNAQRRCFLRQSEFYVCPKDGRNSQQRWQCGGPESLYCKAWGCETTGSAWWKPSSSWDWITVHRNFTPGWENCRYSSTGPCDSLCNPLNITFTTKGRDISTLSSWMKGRTWGLRYYVTGYDFGLWFTIRLKNTSAPSYQ